jgi:hypothetical protein
MSQALNRLRAMGDRASAASLRWNLDLVLDQRGADMADLPGGASGLLVRDCKGKDANRLVTRIDHGVVSLVAELSGHQRQAAEESEQWKTRVDHTRHADEDGGTRGVGEEGAQAPAPAAGQAPAVPTRALLSRRPQRVFHRRLHHLLRLERGGCAKVAHQYRVDQPLRKNDPYWNKWPDASYVRQTDPVPGAGSTTARRRPVRSDLQVRAATRPCGLEHRTG